MITEGHFEVVSKFGPAGDQPLAISELKDGLLDGLTHQTLLGVTGSGKTFSVANVIQEVQRPAIVMAPNKTLAASFMGNSDNFFQITPLSTLLAIMITTSRKLTYRPRIPI